MHTTDLARRLPALAPNISRISRHARGTCSEHTAADIAQTIYLRLLERAAQDPTFASRPDSELLVFAQWRGRHMAESGRAYTRNVDAEVFILDEDGEEISAFERIPSASSSPEDCCLQAEQSQSLQAALQSLSPRDRQIVTRIYLQSEPQASVAADLGMTSAGVSIRKANALRHLRRML